MAIAKAPVTGFADVETPSISYHIKIVIIRNEEVEEISGFYPRAHLKFRERFGDVLAAGWGDIQRSPS